MYVRNTEKFFLAATIAVTALVRAEAQTPDWAKVSPEQTAAAKKLGIPVAFENAAGMRFVLIPAGKFKMGAGQTPAEIAKDCAMPNAHAGWFFDETPQHEVTLTKPFYMGVTEVTQGQYEKVNKLNPDPKKKNKDQPKPEYPEGYEGENKPVGKLDWNRADQFCKKLSGQDEQRQYAIPTEAQWEYACRAGTATPFSFGDTVSTKQANYNGNYIYGKGVKGENIEAPVVAGSLPANAWGLHEMHGNLAEICSTPYDKYTAEAKADPTGPEKGGNHKVLRGGSWRSYPGAIRSSFRLGGNVGSYNVGFRVISPLPEPKEEEKKE